MAIYFATLGFMRHMGPRCQDPVRGSEAALAQTKENRQKCFGKQMVIVGEFKERSMQKGKVDWRIKNSYKIHTA